MKGQISYLCLQATREGQASHAHVHEIIKGLRRRGWQVELFEPSYARNEGRPGLLRKFWEWTRTQVSVWLARPRPDVVYIRGHPFSFPTALWARLGGIPSVVEVNGPPDELLLSFPWAKWSLPLVRRSLRVQLRAARAVIAVTPQLRDWALGEAGPKPGYVVPNGANTELFRPDVASPLSLPEKYVVFFGVLARWQGLDNVFSAVEHPEWPGKVKLIVAGDGVERGKVEQAAARNRTVVYLGCRPYREMPGIVAWSLAGLSTQNNDGGKADKGLFPLKVFETMACGVPVIVSDFPGQADMVRKHGCGVVVPPGDPAALARALAYLDGHPVERANMGQRGREAVVRHHSWDRRAQDTEAVLLQALRREPR